MRKHHRGIGRCAAQNEDNYCEATMDAVTDIAHDVTDTIILNDVSFPLSFRQVCAWDNVRRIRAHYDPER